MVFKMREKVDLFIVSIHREQSDNFIKMDLALSNRIRLFSLLINKF